AAVYSVGSKRSPLAVRLPAKPGPYQLATPSGMSSAISSASASGATGEASGSSSGSADGANRGSSAGSSLAGVAATGAAIAASSSARAGPMTPPAARRARAAAAAAFRVDVPSIGGGKYGALAAGETRPPSLHPAESTTRPLTKSSLYPRKPRPFRPPAYRNASP